MPLSPDHLSEEGARRLAERVNEFWAAKGAVVNARVARQLFWREGNAVHEQEATGDYRAVYGVRSDLRGGLPVKSTAAIKP